MELRVRKPIDRIRLAGAGFDEKRKATPEGTRQGRDSLPLFRLENLAPGDWFKGPCLVEEAFFTAHVRPGWRFVVSGNGDLFLRRDRE